MQKPPAILDGRFSIGYNNPAGNPHCRRDGWKRTAGRYVGAATNLYSMLGEQKLRDLLQKVIYPLT
jgi:hypothetical protein